MGGVFIRGLVGNKVNVFVDGVRYSNGAQRGGVNTFLSLIEAGSLDSIEILRGPSNKRWEQTHLSTLDLGDRRTRVGLRSGAHEVVVDFENLGDENYRDLSWGVDGPGRGISLRYGFRF